jgi:tetratricopeptide (TPR) repeat protein
VTAVAAPLVARWYEARRSVAAPPGATPLPVAGRPAPRATPDLPGPATPEPSTAPVPTAGPEVALGQEAVRLYREGRVAEACERFREAAVRAPGEVTRANAARCSGRLGRDAYQAGQPAEAVRHYAQAVELDPGTREWWHALAIAQMRSGDPGRARAVLQDALSRLGDDGETLYLLAEAQERQGQTREAVATLRRLLAGQPGHARGRTLLATLDREQKVEGAYWSQESEHFLVRYEGAQGIDLGRSVVDTLEEAYRSIGQDLGAFPREKVQVGIYATEVLGQVIGIPAHYIRGAFDGRKLRLNLAESAAYSNSLSRLVRHEYAHAVIHLATNGRAPVWVHEGLAQVMEPRDPPRFLEISVPRELLTLTGVERMARTMDPVAFTAGYQLTHVAASHLVDRGGLAGIRDFLARLGKGEAVPQALRGAFGFGVDEVEARIRAVAGRS